MVDDTKVEETGDDLLARAHESRGFHLGVHEIMHGADQEYMQHYQRWLEFANIKERHLDKKTKQIVHVAVDIARNANPDHIRAHMVAGVKAGVSEEDILAVRDWQNADQLTGADRAILQAVDEMLDVGKISDPTWAECCKHVPTDGERVEMVVCIANWIMFSNLLRTLEIPVEDGVMSWPPDGRVPESAAS